MTATADQPTVAAPAVSASTSRVETLSVQDFLWAAGVKAGCFFTVEEIRVDDKEFYEWGEVKADMAQIRDSADVVAVLKRNLGNTHRITLDSKRKIISIQDKILSGGGQVLDQRVSLECKNSLPGLVMKLSDLTDRKIILNNMMLTGAGVQEQYDGVNTTVNVVAKETSIRHILTDYFFPRQGYPVLWVATVTPAKTWVRYRQP